MDGNGYSAGHNNNRALCYMQWPCVTGRNGPSLHITDDLSQLFHCKTLLNQVDKAIRTNNLNINNPSFPIVKKLLQYTAIGVCDF